MLSEGAVDYDTLVKFQDLLNSHVPHNIFRLSGIQK